ncbi:hypothetical protein OOK41_00110 [Micromonospora sp. NBC_01655]|uniref:hypothetical protein n=1 Tax=Micromonospora sp. NBC_01655 TaxID=2975983 RepID=UPI0022587EC7|nr:hypothetical protein [Micromonospora sp. NBC_01655]MCX4468734.1 hypothetical protein [Micromonospora sp. NBC_01655]
MGQARWQVIGEAEWSDAQDPASQRWTAGDRRVCTGPVVHGAIGLAGAAVGGGRHIEVAGDGTVLDYRPGTGWVVARLKELERHQPSVLVIDDKALAEEAEAAGLTVHRANVGDMVAGCQLLYDGICGPDVGGRDVAHIGQGVLTDAARGAVKRDVGGSWAWARRDVAVDTTTLAAVGAACSATPRLGCWPVADPAGRIRRSRPKEVPRWQCLSTPT